MKKVPITLLAMLLSAGASAKATYTVKEYVEPHAKGFDRTIAIPRTNWESQRNTASPIPGSADISASVSLPENQGSCGSCWDFSLTKALRSEYMVKNKDPGVLEFNFLLNNCGKGPNMWGCGGGSFSAAASFLNSGGPGLNTSNPYTGQDNSGCANLPVSATAKNYKMLGDKGAQPTFKDLAYAVAVEKHMVSIDVAAGAGDWENYSEGIYNGCSGSADDIDHMIDLVGYNCETSVDAQGQCVFNAAGRPINGDGYLIVENNWGEYWETSAANKHGGYMKTRMYGTDGSNCNAIATDALVFQIS